MQAAPAFSDVPSVTHRLELAPDSCEQRVVGDTSQARFRFEPENTEDIYDISKTLKKDAR